MAGLSQAQRRTVVALAERHGVASVRVFGSMARGSAGAESDLDLLVRFKTPATLLQVIGFKQALEEALKLRVDLVEEGGISPHIRERVLNEAIAL